MNLIPTKKNLRHSARSSSTIVGTAVGVVIGLPLGFIGIAIFGGIGATMGRSIGDKNGEKAEQLLFLKYKDEEFKQFPKPIISDTARCVGCERHFTTFRKRKHCGLCGRSFCGDDLRKRAYIRFEENAYFVYTKVCPSCWEANADPSHH